MPRRGTDWNRIHRARLREIKQYVGREFLPKSTNPATWTRAEKRRIREYHRRIHGTRTKDAKGKPLQGSRHLAHVVIDGKRTRRMRQTWSQRGARDASGYLAKEYRPQTPAARRAAFSQFAPGIPTRGLTTVWIPTEHPESMRVRFDRRSETFSLSFPGQRIRELILKPRTPREWAKMLTNPKGWAQDQVRRLSRYQGEQYWRVHTTSGIVGQVKADLEMLTDQVSLPSSDPEAFITEFEGLGEYSTLDLWFSYVSVTIIR